MTKFHKLIVGSVLGASALLMGNGCTVTTGPGAVDGYAYVRADSPPVAVEQYPHTRYHDRDAYFVNGQWYWAGNDGWYVFRDEPSDLRRWRSQHNNATVSAPPAYGAGVQRPPPAWGGGPAQPAAPYGGQKPPPAY